MKKYKINKGFITQKKGDMLTIFDSEQSVLYSLNKTATLIFQMIKSGKSDKVISEKIVKDFDISIKLAEKDVKELVADLKKKKIIIEISQ